MTRPDHQPDPHPALPERRDVQAELGLRIGVTRQTIAAIEAGKYSPSLEAAFRIADVFGKSLDEVFQWEQ